MDAAAHWLTSQLGAVSTPVDWPWEFRWLILAWLGAVGASLGSFLNVVVYRLPAGLSVVSPGSRCPKCLHSIRGYDNLPVLSWLLLKGRCRDCGAPIAPRYPAVEATAGLVTVALALVELYPLDRLPSAWQPHGPDPLAGMAAWIGFAGHLLVLLTLLAGALMEWDGHVPPVRLFGPAVLFALFTCVAFPETGDWVTIGPGLDLPQGMRGPVAGLAGAGLGSFVGRFVGGGPQAPQQRLIWAVALATSGLAWGISYVVIQAAVLLVAGLVCHTSGRRANRPVPPLAGAFAAALALSLLRRWW